MGRFADNTCGLSSNKYLETLRYQIAHFPLSFIIPDKKCNIGLDFWITVHVENTYERLLND